LDPFLYLFDDYIWYLRTINKGDLNCLKRVTTIPEDDIISCSPYSLEHYNNYLHEEGLVNLGLEESNCMREVILNELSKTKNVPAKECKRAAQKKMMQRFLNIQVTEHTIIARQIHIPSS